MTPNAPSAGAALPSTLTSRPPALPVPSDRPGLSGTRYTSPERITRVKIWLSCASRIWIQLVPVARITIRAGPLVTPNTCEGSAGALTAGTGGRAATSVGDAGRPEAGAVGALVDVSTRGCGTGGKGEVATGATGAGALTEAGAVGGGGSGLAGDGMVGCGAVATIDRVGGAAGAALGAVAEPDEEDAAAAASVGACGSFCVAEMGVALTPSGGRSELGTLPTRLRWARLPDET